MASAHVVVAAEKLDAKAAYVACSRGRYGVAVHTPDKQRLIERLPHDERTAALDVLGRRQTDRSTPRPSIIARAKAWLAQQMPFSSSLPRQVRSPTRHQTPTHHAAQQHAHSLRAGFRSKNSPRHSC